MVKWEGETLVVTKKTLQFGNDKAVAYRELVTGRDRRDFALFITARGEVNAFPGKWVALHCERDEMEMTTYSSREALQKRAEPLSRVAWFK